MSSDAVDRNARLATVLPSTRGYHCHTRGGWPDRMQAETLAALPEVRAR